MTLEWRPVFGYEGLYEVSNDGLVRSKRGRLLAFTRHWNGYLRVGLWKDGAKKQHYVHRLVATAFLGLPPAPKLDAAHNDGSRDNNHASNLRWATRAENMADKKIHGTENYVMGESHGNAKLTLLAVREIRATKTSAKSLAEKFGVSKGLIHKVRAGNAWRFAGA